MNWQHLFDAARLLAGAPDAGGISPRPGRPRQAMLRRAISAAYYAMFHALCQSNADTLVGDAATGNNAELWARAYRALDHRPAKNRLASYTSEGAPALSGFASLFGDLQSQRHDADYNPRRMFLRSQVIAIIDQAEAETQALYNMPIPQRRALAVHLLLASRNRS